jgi:hypothetical protein
MTLKKSTKKDKAWQERIEKQVKVEKLKIDNPNGKEGFERAIKRVLKKRR